MTAKGPRLSLHLCRECLSADQSEWPSHLRGLLDAALPGQVRLHEAPCMARCDAPLVLSLQRQGGAGYVFAGLRAGDGADIVATCRAYLESRDGWIEDARPCGRLRHCLAARLPA